MSLHNQEFSAFDLGYDYVDRSVEAENGGYLPLDRMSRMVRHANERPFAGAPLYALLGYKRLVATESAYVDPNPLVNLGSKDWRRSAYICMGFDIDQDLPIGLWDAVFPDMPFAVAVGRITRDKPDVIQRPHVLMWLKYPVRKIIPELDKKKKTPIDPKKDWRKSDLWRFDRIQAEVVTRLHAAGIEVDTKGGIQKTLWKNPNYRNWQVLEGDTDRTWTLADLEKALGIHRSQRPPTDPKDKKGRGENVIDFPFRHRPKGLKLSEQGDGRGTTIFEAVRHLAYGHYRRGMSEEAMYMFCEQHAYDFNAEFVEGLTAGQVRSIARSISRWVVNRYNPKTVERDRGAAKKLMETAITTADKQSRGAVYTHAKRSLETYEKVQEAKKELGDAANVSSVARLLKMDRKRVREHFYAESFEDTETGRKMAELLGGKVVPELDFRRRLNAAKQAAQNTEQGGGAYGVYQKTVSPNKDEQREEQGGTVVPFRRSTRNSDIGSFEELESEDQILESWREEIGKDPRSMVPESDSEVFEDPIYTSSGQDSDNDDDDDIPW